jgi:type I restriction enzyme S subunit
MFAGCYNYFLKTLDLAAFNSGSAQPSLNRNYIHPIRITVPDRSEQNRIVDLLGALDDKIDLNRRMNETLEAMARALFNDWFVDFGPVRAKAEGRQPSGLSPKIAALFLDALDDDDKPVGWDTTTIGDLCTGLIRIRAMSSILTQCLCTSA